MNYKQIEEAIENFKSIKVLVIGDIILDHFIYGKVTRISPEAPVPVVNVIHEKFMLGGAANVLNNIISLGGQGILCGIRGNDFAGDQTEQLILDLPSSVDGIIKDDEIATIKKSRVIANNQQICRIDREKIISLSSDQIDKINCTLSRNIATYGPDIIVISDYVKGMINAECMKRLNVILSHFTIPIIVDPKPNNKNYFKFLDSIKHKIITPNLREAEKLTGISLSYDNKISSSKIINTLKGIIYKIKNSYHFQQVLLTLAEKGVAYLDSNENLKIIPATAKEVFDITGAGDTIVAVMALGIASRLFFADAAKIANLAAGIVIGKMGTAVITKDELIKGLRGLK